jgi:hypothetical protein
VGGEVGVFVGVNDGEMEGEEVGVVVGGRDGV